MRRIVGDITPRSSTSRSFTTFPPLVHSTTPWGNPVEKVAWVLLWLRGHGTRSP